MILDASTQEVLFRLIESGVFESAERLAKMSQTQWQMQSVSIKMGAIAKATFIIDSDDHYGNYFSMPGGFFLVIFSQKSGAQLAETFMARNCKPKESPSELEQTALAEISNVMINAVVRNLADACDMALFVSAPQPLRGTKESLLKQAAARFRSAGEDIVISTNVHMSSQALAADCTLIFLLDRKLLQRLIDSLE